MPQFVQQATTYGYDKAVPYLDTACKKVPLVQSFVTHLVPYAKPSVQLADRIVDTALNLVSKPVERAQATVSLFSGRVGDCKTVVVTKVSCAKGMASNKVVACKSAIATKVSFAKGIALDTASVYMTSVTEALEEYKSFFGEKTSMALQFLQQYKVMATVRLGQASSWASAQLHSLALRLRFIELKDMITAKVVSMSAWICTKKQEVKDMAFSKANALKASALELRDTVYLKGSAGKKHVMATIETMPGKAYSSAAHMFGNTRVDSVLAMAAKYAPAKMHVAMTKTKAE
jgi:hypothetical protein